MSDDPDPRQPPDDRGDLAEVARVYGPFEADLIKSFLASHGIAAVVLGRAAPFVYPLTVDGLAEFKVLVTPADLEKARELLASRPSPDDDEGPVDPA